MLTDDQYYHLQVPSIGSRRAKKLIAIRQSVLRTSKDRTRQTSVTDSLQVAGGGSVAVGGGLWRGVIKAASSVAASSEDRPADHVAGTQGDFAVSTGAV